MTKRLFDQRWNKPQYKALTDCKLKATEAAIAYFRDDLNYPAYRAGILARYLTSKVIKSMLINIKANDPEIVVTETDCIDSVVSAVQKLAYQLGTIELEKIIKDEVIREDKEKYDF